MGLGAGKAPVGPGTAGSVLGLAFWWWWFRQAEPGVYAALMLIGVWLAVRVTGEAARLMGEKDPSCVVLDEMAAIPVALMGVGESAGWWVVALGFVWFRVFDIVKPPPVRWVERLPAGWGIVADDVVAGLYACGATHGCVWLISRWMTG